MCFRFVEIWIKIFLKKLLLNDEDLKFEKYIVLEESLKF